jgi:hypothetical protein
MREEEEWGKGEKNEEKAEEKKRFHDILFGIKVLKLHFFVAFSSLIPDLNINLKNLTSDANTGLILKMTKQNDSVDIED